MNNKSCIAIKSVQKNRGLEKLKLQLIVARQDLLEKDKIIEGLRLDLAHLVNQLPKIKQW